MWADSQPRVIHQHESVFGHLFDRHRRADGLAAAHPAVVKRKALEFRGQAVHLWLPAITVQPYALDEDDGRTIALDLKAYRAVFVNAGLHCIFAWHL